MKVLLLSTLTTRDLVPQSLRWNHSDLIDETLVGAISQKSPETTISYRSSAWVWEEGGIEIHSLEIKGETRVVFLNEDSGCLLDSLCADSTLS